MIAFMSLLLFFMLLISVVNAQQQCQNCDCGWASVSTCGTNDGTLCNGCCCASFRAPQSTPAPAAPAAAPSTDADIGGNNDAACQNCGCSWASAFTCGSNDGSLCNRCCCASFRGGSSSTRPAASTTTIVGNGGGGGGGSDNSGSVQYQGNAVTTRYWDCCKPSCAWPSNVVNMLQGPVKTCQRDGVTAASANAKNVCSGGGDSSVPTAYMCSNTQPFSKNGVLLGFAASNRDCCQCIELLFTSGSVSGKRMIVQVTNKGGDLGSNHYDLQMPGGGVGIFNGCAGRPPNGAAQFSDPIENWGQTYGGVATMADCMRLPSALRAGCLWRFADFKGADNPNAKFRRVKCPRELTNISKCILKDDASQPVAVTSTGSPLFREDETETLPDGDVNESSSTSASLSIVAAIVFVALGVVF